MGQDHYAEEEKLSRELLDIRRRIHGPEHPRALGVMSTLATALRGEGRYPEAEKLDQQVIDIERRVLGPEHFERLNTMVNLAYLLMKAGH